MLMMPIKISRLLRGSPDRRVAVTFRCAGAACPSQDRALMLEFSPRSLYLEPYQQSSFPSFYLSHKLPMEAGMTLIGQTTDGCMGIGMGAKGPEKIT